MSQVMQRAVKALQGGLAREAVLPSVGCVVGAAAVASLARLAVSCGDTAAVAPRCQYQIHVVIVQRQGSAYHTVQRGWASAPESRRSVRIATAGRIQLLEVALHAHVHCKLADVP
jgi:hypothetical protein